jgi:hypothetical protein
LDQLPEMDIALINSWPNLENSAEMSFIRRFRRVAEKLGHRTFAVVTSDDIEACNPDFVIALDEISPKLTSVPTFGAMWTPPLLYHREARRSRSILSYDGYLVGSDPIRSYLKDFEFSLGITKPKSEFLFLPTVSSETVPPRRGSRWELGYGMPGGDDRPQRDLVAALEAADLIKPSSGGEPPEHGVALCLHTAEQHDADMPSAELFEAAAAGKVIITDELPFARRVLGDAALYVDTKASLADAVDQVRSHLAWLNGEPARGEQLVAEAHKILKGGFDRPGLRIRRKGHRGYAAVEACCARWPAGCRGLGAEPSVRIAGETFGGFARAPVGRRHRSRRRTPAQDRGACAALDRATGRRDLSRDRGRLQGQPGIGRVRRRVPGPEHDRDLRQKRGHRVPEHEPLDRPRPCRGSLLRRARRR